MGIYQFLNFVNLTLQIFSIYFGCGTLDPLFRNQCSKIQNLILDLQLQKPNGLYKDRHTPTAIKTPILTSINFVRISANRFIFFLQKNWATGVIDNVNNKTTHSISHVEIQRHFRAAITIKLERVLNSTLCNKQGGSLGRGRRNVDSVRSNLTIIVNIKLIFKREKKKCFK